MRKAVDEPVFGGWSSVAQRQGVVSDAKRVVLRSILELRRVGERRESATFWLLDRNRIQNCTYMFSASAGNTTRAGYIPLITGPSSTSKSTIATPRIQRRIRTSTSGSTTSESSSEFLRRDLVSNCGTLGSVCDLDKARGRWDSVEDGRGRLSRLVFRANGGAVPEAGDGPAGDAKADDETESALNSPSPMSSSSTESVKGMEQAQVE